jgi:hypothetical protein
MPWKAEMLEQGAHLRDRAEAQTDNVNEAHLLVHGVMARAFAEVGDKPRNLDGALTEALEGWVYDDAA